MTDIQYMRAAITEARKGMGRTHPNPAVGAVIVHQGKVVAAGHTQPAGQAHAEVVALSQFASAGLAADASTVLYVTLEPCCTTGRTPPCTDAIIQSGIGTVVIGSRDPNPKHHGQAKQLLEQAGVVVREGVLEKDCRDLNLIFNWQMEKGSPFFAGKIATTIDGCIATRAGSSKWITGDAARADVHFWRGYFPAIAVGAGTVLADNPSLTCRIPGQPESCPDRFIFDSGLTSFREPLPKVYGDAFKDRTIVVTDASQALRSARLEEEHGIRFWLIEDVSAASGMSAFARRFAQSEHTGLYIEGGARLLSTFLRHKLLHYLFAYRAPRLLADDNGLHPFMGQHPGTMGEAIGLEEVHQASFGEDQLMRGFVVYP